jgi:3-oxoacyl-(acyl-carrier-protein) synthase
MTCARKQKTMTQQPLRRVVITGLGVISPIGIGKDTFWQATIAGRSGIRSITRFDASALPTRIAGEVPNFIPESLGLSTLEIASLDRGTQFALAAANLALQDSGLHVLNKTERDAMGVCIGNAMASADEGERLWMQFTDRGVMFPRLNWQDACPERLFMSYVPASAIASHHRLHGPCMTISTGCSAGADAIGQAFWAIQQGQADRMLAGGSDSAINASSINVFSVMKALSTRNEDPERASRPYDGLRDGFVMAEGAGVLLLEDLESALVRHAHIYAEILTFVSNCNAYHMTALPEDGAPLQQLLRSTLEKAALSPQQLGYINSHGSSTPYNERAETSAYKAVFGDYASRIPISATKSMIGHTQGAASAIETIVTALALEHQLLPPTINQEFADPHCDLDYIPNVARPAHLDYALTHSSGFGGVNTALVLARFPVGTGVGADERRGPRACPGWDGEKTPGYAISPRRVVVTGLGVVAPNGIGKETFWRSLSQGKSGIQPVQRFSTRDLPIRVAGEIADFLPENYLDRKLVNRTDRVTHLALVAAAEALQDASLSIGDVDPRRVGAVIANTFGGAEFVIEQIHALHTRGPRFMSAYSAIAWLQVANVGQLSLRYGFQGYCKAPVNDLVGGLDALGLAYRAIQRGEADILLAGGCEAPVHPYFLLLFSESGLFATGDDPSAYRPFDHHARGLLPAEGAGICILEDYEHALRRGASIYGEITAYAQTATTQRFYHPSPEHEHYAGAIRLALQEACLRPADVDYFSLDGRAQPILDEAEAQTIHSVFGPHAASLLSSVPRTLYGHPFAAAGAIDTITTLLALKHSLVLPTTTGEADPRYGLPIVQKTQEREIHNALIAGRSWGGANVVLALRK